MTRTPGEHVPNIKNRSSKQLICLTKHKPIVRSLSNEALMKIKYDDDASKELRRREKKNKNDQKTK